MPERATPRERRSEKSAEAVLATGQRGRGEGPKVRESETTVSLEGARPQMSGQLELPLGRRGEAPRAERSGEASTATDGDERSGASGLMEAVVEPQNLRAALKRVRQNKGSPGIDGMSVEELPNYLREHWPGLREELLAGCYQPRPVRRQSIPKRGGGMRELGIPCVLDRFIQQALLQVLQPKFDPTFSGHGHGLRPGRRAHDAVRAERTPVGGGCGPGEVFRPGRPRRADGKARGSNGGQAGAGTYPSLPRSGHPGRRGGGGAMGGDAAGWAALSASGQRASGLDEVDRSLERRGHASVRYADDCNVYVRSKRAGERVMAFLERRYARLRLRINPAKSAVAPVWQRSFLGFGFWRAQGGEVRRRVAKKALGAMKDRVRELTARNRGRSISHVVAELRGFLVGWKEYFRLADTPRIFRELDEWLRHRLRAIHLKQWKRGRTIYRELCARGMTGHRARQVAANGRRWWKNAGMAIHIALPNRYFDELGVPRLAA